MTMPKPFTEDVEARAKDLEKNFEKNKIEFEKVEIKKGTLIAQLKDGLSTVEVEYIVGPKMRVKVETATSTDKKKVEKFEKTVDGWDKMFPTLDEAIADVSKKLMPEIGKAGLQKLLDFQTALHKLNPKAIKEISTPQAKIQEAIAILESALR